MRRVREVAEGVAAGLGARAEVSIVAELRPGGQRTTRWSTVVRANAERLLGDDHVALIPHGQHGRRGLRLLSERRCPAPSIRSACATKRRASSIPIHHERFDVDEECLAYGAALQALNALAVLGG